MSAPSGNPAELVVVNQRRFTYPSTRLFEAFANPDLLTAWWGPKGFSSTFQKFDFRPGGEWLFILHGPDGGNYDNHITFLEVSIPNRIVMHHHGPMHDFRITILYESLKDFGGNETLVTWRMISKVDPENAEGNAQFKTFLETANEENFDRLEACLKAMPPRI